MRQNAAQRSMSIQIIALLVIFMTAAAITLSAVHWQLTFAAILLAGISLVCYLLSPVAYELSGDHLTVLSHIRAKQFGPVVRCSRIEQTGPRFWVGVRLFGNGGMFCATGFFWNRMLRVFRAYVTSARREDLVLVETMRQRVIISPQDAETFVEAWRIQSGGAGAR